MLARPDNEGPWSFLCKAMWSLKSSPADRISGPEKFCSSARKDFFNSIGPLADLITQTLDVGSTADTKEPQEHHCDKRGHGTPPTTEAPVSPADSQEDLGGPSRFEHGS